MFLQCCKTHRTRTTRIQSNSLTDTIFAAVGISQPRVLCRSSPCDLEPRILLTPPVGVMLLWSCGAGDAKDQGRLLGRSLRMLPGHVLHRAGSSLLAMLVAANSVPACISDNLYCMEHSIRTANCGRPAFVYNRIPGRIYALPHPWAGLSSSIRNFR